MKVKELQEQLENMDSEGEVFIQLDNNGNILLSLDHLTINCAYSGVTLHPDERSWPADRGPFSWAANQMIVSPYPNK